MKRHRMLIACVLCACATLLPGCFAPRVIPDQSIPHQLAAPATLTVWLTMPDGRKVDQAMAFPAGCWIAFPAIVSPQQVTP